MGPERSPYTRLGPYTLGERLGVGGMAEVYLAESEGPHGFAKRVALKRILPQLSRDARFVAMFCDEAKICAMLEHPNIVKVIDFGEANGELFMAMEYVDGISVARLLRAVSARGERFPLGAVLYIAHEILRALSHAHEAIDERGRPLNIVHRDVSPGNVLIGREGEVKLTDFGIVRSAFVDRRTYPGELKGKLGYMSPEQVMGEDLDPRSDLFTAAIIIAELCLVRPLFPGHNELEILTRTHRADLEVLDRFGGNLPASLAAALRRALSASPAERFQTARQFLSVIRDVAKGEGLVLNADQLASWVSSLGVLRLKSGARDLPGTPLQSHQSGARVVTPERPAASASGARPAARRRAEESQDTLVDFEDEITEVGGRYYVQGGRAESDALDVSGVIEKLVTGRLPPDVPLSRDGIHFSPLRCFAEFARFAERPAYAFADGSLADWTLRVTRRELPSLLFFAAVERLTGVLRIDVKGPGRRLFLSDGRPRSVASPDANELLGARLVARGLMDPADLARVLSISCKTGHAFGEVCIAEHLVTPEVLQDQLSQQLEAKLAAIGRLQEAVISYVPGVSSGERGVPENQSRLGWITKLVLGSYSVHEVVQVLGPCLQSRFSPGPVNLAPSELGLTDPMRRALLFACGGETLSGLVQSLRVERIAQERETLFAVFLGLSAGLLSSPGFGDPMASLR
jgi:eukaryotic-like serine/threonine-protein kinase